MSFSGIHKAMATKARTVILTKKETLHRIDVIDKLWGVWSHQ
jgi:hypothetical protein